MSPAEDTALLRDWVARFGQALAAGNAAGVGALFGDECFWRDLVAFTWTKSS